LTQLNLEGRRDSLLRPCWPRGDSPWVGVSASPRTGLFIVDDRVRNELILHDLIQATADGRSPLLLTGRTDHLKYFETELAGKVNNVFTLKGGMGKKQRRSIAEAIAAAPECEPRVILATGSYIGEGFDDARLDTLFRDRSRQSWDQRPLVVYAFRQHGHFRHFRCGGCSRRQIGVRLSYHGN
jgi:hypothetical protein